MKDDHTCPCGNWYVDDAHGSWCWNAVDPDNTGLIGTDEVLVGGDTIVPKDHPLAIYGAPKSYVAHAIAEIESHSHGEKSLAYWALKGVQLERDYVLPCFTMAKEAGIDLQELVDKNPGQNCVKTLVSKLLDERALANTTTAAVYADEARQGWALRAQCEDLMMAWEIVADDTTRECAKALSETLEKSATPALRPDSDLVTALLDRARDVESTCCVLHDEGQLDTALSEFYRGRAKSLREAARIARQHSHVVQPAIGDLASAIGLDLNDPKVRAEVQRIANEPKDPKYQPTTTHTMVAHVVEECGEVLLPVVTAIGQVLQAAGKALRFGMHNCYPKDDDNNATKLLRELTDLKRAAERVLPTLQSYDELGRRIRDAKPEGEGT